MLPSAPVFRFRGMLTRGACITSRSGYPNGVWDIHNHLFRFFHSARQHLDSQPVISGKVPGQLGLLYCRGSLGPCKMQIGQKRTSAASREEGSSGAGSLPAGGSASDAAELSAASSRTRSPGCVSEGAFSTSGSSASRGASSEVACRDITKYKFITKVRLKIRLFSQFLAPKFRVGNLLTKEKSSRLTKAARTSFFGICYSGYQHLRKEAVLAVSAARLGSGFDGLSVELGVLDGGPPVIGD